MKHTRQKGSVDKIGPKGSEDRRLRYYRYFIDEKGERKSKRETEWFNWRDYKSARLIDHAIAKFMEAVNENNARPQNVVTFGQIAEKWENLIMSQLEKRSSRDTFRSKLKVHLLPYFGNKRLTDITPETVQVWVSAQTCAPEHIKGILRLMRSIWRYGKIWGYAEHNPFEGVRRPKVPKDRSYSFTPEQVMKILNEATGWRKLFYWILYETGMRPGECAGLARGDVMPGYLVIRRTIWNCQPQAPKTETANRKPDISERLERAIRRHMAETSTNQLDLLFATRTGRPISTHSLMANSLRPILEKLGIKPDKRAGLYAFRHGNATLMDELNVPLKVRQQRLGHANPNITIANYTHARDAAGHTAAEMIDALLNPAKGELTQ